MRNSAIALPNSPCIFKATPRLQWPIAKPGSIRIAAPEFGHRLVHFPLFIEGRARLVWALASFGASRIAARNSAIAPSSSPRSCRARPSSLWAEASSGLIRIADRNAAIASSSFPSVARMKPKVVVRVREIGIDPDRGAELGDCFLPLALVSQGISQVVVGLGEVRPQSGSPRAEFSNRLLRLLLSCQSDAAVVVNIGVGQYPPGFLILQCHCRGGMDVTECVGVGPLPPRRTDGRDERVERQIMVCQTQRATGFRPILARGVRGGSPARRQREQSSDEPAAGSESPHCEHFAPSGSLMGSASGGAKGDALIPRRRLGNLGKPLRAIWFRNQLLCGVSVLSVRIDGPVARPCHPSG